MSDLIGDLPSSLEAQLKGFRLTTAQIYYHLPDHPELLQEFIWQHYDLAPKFPILTPVSTNFEDSLIDLLQK